MIQIPKEQLKCLFLLAKQVNINFFSVDWSMYVMSSIIVQDFLCHTPESPFWPPDKILDNILMITMYYH